MYASLVVLALACDPPGTYASYGGPYGAPPVGYSNGYSYGGYRQGNGYSYSNGYSFAPPQRYSSEYSRGHLLTLTIGRDGRARFVADEGPRYLEYRTALPFGYPGNGGYPVAPLTAETRYPGGRFPGPGPAL